MSDLDGELIALLYVSGLLNNDPPPSIDSLKNSVQEAIARLQSGGTLEPPPDVEEPPPPPPEEPVDRQECLLGVKSGVNATAAPPNNPPVTNPNGWLAFELEGQSQLEGFQTLRYTDSGIIPGVWLYGYINDATIGAVSRFGWEPATVPLARYSATGNSYANDTKYSWAKAFSERIRDVTKKDVALCISAKGGTKLSMWIKGSTYWVSCRKRTKGIRFDGYVFNQGENDVADPTWINRIQTHIADIRAEHSAPNLWCGLTEVLHGFTDPAYEAHNARLATLSLPCVSVVSTEGLRAYPLDGVHYDHPSSDILGVRIADAYLKHEGWI